VPGRLFVREREASFGSVRTSEELQPIGIESLVKPIGTVIAVAGRWAQEAIVAARGRSSLGADARECLLESRMPAPTWRR
jgi:hypothetical protein